MDKNKLDDNFEKLKQSILEKKLKAEAVKKNVYKNTDVCIDVDATVDIDVNKDVNTNVDNHVNTNTYIDDDIEVYTNVNKNTYIPDYNIVNVTENNNVNKFVIKPKEIEEKPIRYTIYLKPDTIQRIGHYSKLLNLGKSEFAQKIFDYFLNNIEIID